MTQRVNRAHDAYRTNVVQTQTQGKLVYMLYEGAIKFLMKAEDAIQEKNVQEAHVNIVKTQNILSELSNTLNLEVGEIGNQLLMMYDYMMKRLVEANIKKDAEILKEVRGYFEELAEAWKAII